MKTRFGFVSNSSSASYIVNVFLTKSEFVSHMRGLLPYIKTFIAELQKGIELFSKSEEENLTFSDMTLRLKDLLVEAEKLDTGNIDYVTYTELYLKAKRISYDFVESRPYVKLESWVTMHNDYNDIPEYLREIILSLLFAKVKMDCTVEHDY